MIGRNSDPYRDPKWNR